MSFGDGLDHAPLDHLVCEFPRRPVGHRTAAVLWLLAGDGEDLRQLLGAEGARPARPRFIGEHVADQRGKILVAGVLLLCGSKPARFSAFTHMRMYASADRNRGSSCLSDTPSRRASSITSGSRPMWIMPSLLKSTVRLPNCGCLKVTSPP